MTIEQNDPTASGFTPPASGLVRLSGNETETLCLKAARGGGMPWGLAEEAGFAAKWLQLRGVDGPAALLAHLDWLATRDFDAVCPISPEDLRPRDGGILCPIVTGATLSDMAELPQAPVGPVTAPILLVPFLHVVARQAERTVLATWRDGRVAVSPDGRIDGPIDLLSVAKEATLELADTDASEPESPESGQDRRPSAACLARLNDYAMNITVPASRSSRIDAGAASDDND